MITKERLKSIVQRLESLWYGKILDFFEDPKAIEIMVNPDGSVYLESLGSGMEMVGKMEPAVVDEVLRVVADYVGSTVTVTSPIVEGALPERFRRSRFSGAVPPIVEAPTFCIRIPARSVFRLEDYVAKGIMTREQSETLKQALHDHKNILVSGGTGSGKSTLLNALLAELDGSDERVLIIEDTPELQCLVPNRVNVLTDVLAGVTMQTLLKYALRQRPDRILVGEVRDGSALALLKAWNTGHPGGLATLHANSPEAALLRLDQLCQEAGVPSQRVLVEEAVDVVVQIAKDLEKGRKVTGILVC